MGTARRDAASRGFLLLHGGRACVVPYARIVAGVLRTGKKSTSNAGVVFLKTNTTICLKARMRPWAGGGRGTEMIGGPDTISQSTDYLSHQAETSKKLFLYI